MKTTETKRHYRVRIDGRDMGLFLASYEGEAATAARHAYIKQYGEAPPRHSYTTPWEIVTEPPGWLISKASRAYRWALRLEVGRTLAPDLRRMLQDVRMRLHTAISRKDEEALHRGVSEAEHIAKSWGLEGFKA